MEPETQTLKLDVSRLRTEIADAYNNCRDLSDRLCNAERELAEARKNGGIWRD